MELLITQHQEQLMDSMPWVVRYKKRLDSLNDWWNKISLIGKINSHSIDTMIFSDMRTTKEKLSELQKNLIDNLLTEEVKKSVLDSGSKAQVAIDILIRNLFERTADVGFLATDSDIRDFLQRSEVLDTEREQLRERLEEYVKKYSVYHDIIITDIDGNVKAQLDMSAPVFKTNDPLIAESVKSNDEYLEIYRHTDLKPEKSNSLVYSCKITENNEKNSKVIGVLCLFFKFEDEMKGIFEHLNSTDDGGYLMLTDQNGTVVSSSRPFSSTRCKTKAVTRPELISQDGEYYISISAETKGYQGFYGLGWYGRTILPLKGAFSSYGLTKESARTQEGTAELSTSALFSEELKQIHFNSMDVNEDLRLIVLNGIITAARASAAEFVPVLEEIKKIGDNTAAIFSESIRRLRDTVLSSQLQSIQFTARLAVDIMDRNLYERANDCRWWALTTVFRQLLAKESLSSQEQDELASILLYINDLYTVYTNLYLYDRNGKILAVSNQQEKWMVGQQVSSTSGAPQALNIRDSQKYAVSDFVTTPYYGDKHTYIYNASVTELGRSDNVVGGIGIVFDSEPQFKDMLTDTLPIDEQGKVVAGCFGTFVNRDGMIISVTDNAPVQVGEKLQLEDSSLLKVENGDSKGCLLTYQGTEYVIGVSASEGYREYKTTGDYNNDVLAVIFLPL